MNYESKQVKVQENRTRRACAREGMVLRKSRRTFSINNRGHYMVLDAMTNRVVCGERFDATLDQIEQWLQSAGNTAV